MRFGGARWSAVLSGAVAALGCAVLLTPVTGLLARSSALQAQTPGAQAPPTLPAGPGHDVFVKTCSGCHAATLATMQRKSEDDWTTIVIEMRGRGANGSDEDMEAIVGYLATNFGTSTPPPHVNVNTATAAELAGSLSLTLAQGTAMVAWRDKNGRFKDAAAVEQVPGVDAAKIEAAKDRIEF